MTSSPALGVSILIVLFVWIIAIGALALFLNWVFGRDR